MIHIIVILLYSLIGMMSSIVFFGQNKGQGLRFGKRFTMGYFFVVHLLLFLTGIALFMYHIPYILLILLLTLAWLSRISNGVFIFARVHVLHHIITACLFGAIVMGYYYGV